MRKGRAALNLSLNHTLAATPPQFPKFVATSHLESHNAPKLTHTSTYTTLQTSYRPRAATMKLLTLNFLTCAIKTCKTQASSFPLHPRDVELEIQEADVNLPFLKNILPRLMWEELRTICKEVRPPPALPKLPLIPYRTHL